MALTVAVQMDHVADISIAGDSTFALLLECQRRGHDLFHYTPDRMALTDGEVFATVEALEVRDVVGDHCTLGEKHRRRLGDFDVILLRQDPPFDLNYITTTHFLERIHPETFVVNDPVSVRNAPEKVFVMEFPDLMPPTLISRDESEIRAFRDKHGDVVFKPLYGHGGAAVFRVRKNDMNFGFADGHVFRQLPRTLGDPAIPRGGSRRGQAHHSCRRGIRRGGEPGAGRG